jgi:hypothetical protein
MSKELGAVLLAAAASEAKLAKAQSFIMLVKKNWCRSAMIVLMWV